MVWCARMLGVTVLWVILSVMPGGEGVLGDSDTDYSGALQNYLHHVKENSLEDEDNVVDFVDKRRPPSGFVGSRGKKAPSGFVGSRGKRLGHDIFISSKGKRMDGHEKADPLEDEDQFEIDTLREKKGAPFGFYMSRGKKAAPFGFYMSRGKKAAPFGFYMSRGKKAAPFGFYMSRGKKAPSWGFSFTRGKKDMDMQEYDGSSGGEYKQELLDLVNYFNDVKQPFESSGKED